MGFVWLKRYEKEGLEALKNKPRTGRPSVIKRRYLQHKNNVKRKQQSELDHKTALFT
jgi:transposase